MRKKKKLFQQADSDEEEEREKMEREKKMTFYPDLSSIIQDRLDYFQTRLCQFAFFVYTITLFSGWNFREFQRCW